MGNKTGVTVVGDYKLEGADEEATKKAVIQMSEQSFNEDNENLKKMK